MMNRIKQTLAATVITLLCGCATTIDYMLVGTGTHRDNKIYAGIIRFDEKWSAATGVMTCCWEWATGTQSVYNVTPPKHLYVKWYDYDPGIYYEANVTLSEDLYEYATNLPPFRWVSSNEIQKNVRPYLIIGFGERGEVVVWISNATDERNIEGRVLYEVGRAQATIVQPDENGRG